MESSKSKPKSRGWELRRIAKLRWLRNLGLSYRQIARYLETSEYLIQDACRRYRAVKPDGAKPTAELLALLGLSDPPRMGGRAGTPGPEEIARRCAEIRAKRGQP